MVDEFSLYEILFRSNSKLAKQFRKEICEWLKKSRLEQKLITEERVKKLENEVNTLKEEKRLELLAKNNTHRITWYKQKETNELLFAVSYHINNRA